MTSWAAVFKALYQPSRPAFWLLLVLNVLSSLLVWAAQHLPLSTWGLVMVLLFALGNLWWSWRLAQQLLHTAPDTSQ